MLERDGAKDWKRPLKAEVVLASLVRYRQREKQHNVLEEKYRSYLKRCSTSQCCFGDRFWPRKLGSFEQISGMAFKRGSSHLIYESKVSRIGLSTN